MESSTSSCALALTEAASVEQAVSTVAERSFFAFAEPADPSVPAVPASVGAPAVTASVAFTGPNRGEMCVTMPTTLAHELAQLFSGDPDLVFSDADLLDMAGEFANMVTGVWLTAADAASVFDLAGPRVALVDTAPDAALLMQINGQPVGLAWHLT